MRSLHRYLFIAGASVAAAVGCYSYAQHVAYVELHTMPPGMRAFDVLGPMPICGRWKDTMPKTRDPAAYKIYIDARNFWRSKVEWQFTRQEALGILRDVRHAADRGDWGARALLAYFYRPDLAR